MASDIAGPRALALTVATAVLSTLTVIGLGTSFKIVGNNPAGQKSGGSGSVLQTWATSGALVGKLNSSGSLVLSGSVVIGQRKTGTGYLFLKGTRGGMVCAADSGGAGGCTCCYYNLGAQVCRVGLTAECAPRDAQ